VLRFGQAWRRRACLVEGSLDRAHVVGAKQLPIRADDDARLRQLTSLKLQVDQQL